MAVRVANPNYSLRFSLSMLRIMGFWSPNDIDSTKKLIYNFYGVFSFMFLLGTYLVTQVVDLFMIWGNIPLMTGTAYILFTNLAQASKFLNLVVREKQIRRIIDGADKVLSNVESDEAKAIVRRCDRETKIQLWAFITLTSVTLVGFAGGAQSGELPLRAWFPYDVRKSPAYELTYTHQVYALFAAALLNISKDTIVTTLLAQCYCRMKLIGLSLRTLCQDLYVDDTLLLTSRQEKIVKSRLRSCVVEHQAALNTARELQACFSEPTFTQFNVSLVIICATAFQLVSQTGNIVHLMSMGTYLTNMMYQVFLYCYQGNQLTEESSKIAMAAYLSPWHSMSPGLRKELLFIMTRCRRITKVTAGGFTTLSLASFMAIIKASYSLFTLLKQVTEN